jgi:hypothetical protein
VLLLSGLVSTRRPKLLPQPSRRWCVYYLLVCIADAVALLYSVIPFLKPHTSRTPAQEVATCRVRIFCKSVCSSGLGTIKTEPVHVPHLSNPNWSSRSRIELAAPPQALAALLSLEFAAASHHRRSRSATDYRVKEADACPIKPYIVVLRSPLLIVSLVSLLWSQLRRRAFGSPSALSIEIRMANHRTSEEPSSRPWRGHLHQDQVWGTCAAALHSTFWLARPHANAWRRADSCRAAMRALFLSLLAWWCHHDITHILWPFSFRKINSEIR